MDLWPSSYAKQLKQFVSMRCFWNISFLTKTVFSECCAREKRFFNNITSPIYNKKTFCETFLAIKILTYFLSKRKRSVSKRKNQSPGVCHPPVISKAKTIEGARPCAWRGLLLIKYFPSSCNFISNKV